MTANYPKVDPNDMRTWDAAANYLAGVIGAIDTETTAQSRLAAVNAAKQAVYTVTQNIPPYQVQYILGRQDAHTLRLCCTHNMATWYDAVNAVAVFGTAEALSDLCAVMRQQQMSIDLNAALQQASDPRKFGDKIIFTGNLATAKELFRQGAGCTADHAQLFLRVAENGNMDIARLFICNSPVISSNIGTWAQNTMTNGRVALSRRLRELQWEYGGMQPLDHQTLLVTKQLGDSTQMKTVFNFLSRRVTEIVDFGGSRQPSQRDVDFSEYDENALAVYRQKLIDFGGKPDEITYGRLDKTALPKPAAPKSGSPGLRPKE